MGVDPSCNVWVVDVGPAIPGCCRYSLGRIFDEAKSVEICLYENRDRGDSFQPSSTPNDSGLTSDSLSMLLIPGDKWELVTPHFWALYSG